MGKAAEAAGDGGPASGDGGAGDARALCRRRRAARPPAQHTAARRRVRPRRASTDPSPLSASRADEEQLPASTEQVRERPARVGRRRRRRGGGVRAARRRQEGGAAAEGDAVVGAHGHAARAAFPGQRAALPRQRTAAAVRDGASPHYALAAARRVTPPRPPPYHITLTFHYRGDPSRRSARASRSIIDLVFIYWGRDPRRTECDRVPCTAVARRSDH